MGTEEAGGAALHSQLQSWVSEGQKIEIIFMPLELAECSTYWDSGMTCNIMTIL